MKKHNIRIYNNKKQTFTSEWFDNAEQAYTAYVNAIETIKNTISDNESYTVMRFNDGYLMSLEDILK